MEIDIPRLLTGPKRSKLSLPAFEEEDKYSPASPAPSYYSAASTPYSPPSTWNLLSLLSMEDACSPSYSPRSFTFPDAGSCHRHAFIALDYFNRRNDANFQLLDAGPSNVSGDGTWIHCNFKATNPPSWNTSPPRHFFAEIMAETMAVTVCDILEGCKTTTGCSFCTGVIHPTRGLFGGSKLDTVDSQVEGKGYPELDTSAFPCEDKPKPEPFEDKMSEGNRIHAQMALEYYNKQNGTDFKLVDALLCKDLCIWEAPWFHCNFTARPPNLETPKLFFAEMHYVARKKTWAIEACLILEGKTTCGCIHCRGVIHPTHGFMKGNHKSSRKGLPPIINCSLPETDKWRRRAEIALEYHNKVNHTDYELVEVVPSLRSAFSLNGTCHDSNDFGETWYHFNFFAWHNEDGKYIDRVFFAEMAGVHSKYNAGMMETLEVTACSMLGPLADTTSRCGVCSGAIHPTDVSIKGVRKPGDLGMPWASRRDISGTPCRRRTTARFQTLEVYEIRQLKLRRAKIAMEYYNKKNGTDYELGALLGSNKLLPDETWLHINFKARAPNGKFMDFFAEMHGANEFTVTACLILEDCETTDGCNACRDSEVIHPAHGFLKGLPKYDSTPNSSPS